MHVRVARQEAQHGLVGQYLAAVIVVGVVQLAQAGLVDRRARFAVEHADRRGLDKAPDAGGICVFDERFGAIHIDAFQFLPVAAAFVVIPEEGRRMEHHVAALQLAGEAGHVGHVARDQLDSLHSGELLPALLQRAHQGLDRDSAPYQFAHEIVAEQTGRAGDEGGRQWDVFFHVRSNSKFN